MNKAAPSAAAFLDRDGTLIDELGYLGDPDRVRLYPGAARAVRRLNSAQVPVILVTNQSGLARGLFGEADLERVHARLKDLLAQEGAHLDRVLFAAYHPDFPNPLYDPKAHWRKPSPGMLIDAARELRLNLADSIMIGDAARDLEAGARAGLKHLVLVRTGKGRTTEASLSPEQLAHWRVSDDLASAVEHYLKRTAHADQGK